MKLEVSEHTHQARILSDIIYKFDRMWRAPILKHEPYEMISIKIARRSQTVKLSADILVSHIFNPVCNSRLFHPWAISARGRDQDGAVEEPYGHIILPYISLPCGHIILPY